jgi:RNA polymerase sigma factor (TIGR02999 family)
MREGGEITALLARWGQGDRAALDALFPLLYAELHRLADRCFSGERPHHTLQATALLNEAYLRLGAQDHRQCIGRNHFLSVAARVMRQILVDAARKRRAAKRAGGARRLHLTDPGIQAELGCRSGEPLDVLVLEECLERLAAIDARKVRMVELRFFAGLDTAAIAAALELPDYTVRRGLEFALAWLAKELKSQAA